VFDTASKSTAGEPNVRFWRTSHTGGHRFAPTALSLPHGYAWAHLDVDSTLALALGRDPAGIAQHCRGAVTLHSSVAQVADREALARSGWEWASSPREAVVVAHERDTLATTVEVHPTAGSNCGFRLRVELVEHVAMPTCGAVDGPEFKTEPVWAAVDVVELSSDRGVQ
jgi:hypothetical protein